MSEVYLNISNKIKCSLHVISKQHLFILRVIVVAVTTATALDVPLKAALTHLHSRLHPFWHPSCRDSEHDAAASGIIVLNL